MTNPRKYIFFDLDECLLHSTYYGEKPYGQEKHYATGKPGEVVFGLQNSDQSLNNVYRERYTPELYRSTEVYRATLRGGVIDLLKSVREIYPEDGAVQVLTTSTPDYASRLNELFGLGFRPEHLHCRHDISGLNILDRITSGTRPTYLIDNLFFQDNPMKVKYLEPITEGSLNYHRVREYWRSPDDDFTEHETRRILNFISDKEDETDFYSGKI